MDKETNKVEAFGRIINFYEANQVYIVAVKAVEVPFVPKNKRKNQEKPYIRINYPKFYFFKTDNTGVDKVFCNDLVAITGHVVSTPKRNRFGRNFISQALIGDSITLISPDNKSHYNKNLVTLEGPVVSVEQRNGGNVFAIRMNAKNKRFDNYVTVTSFNEDALTLEPGDIISVRARVVNKSVTRDDGYENHYQNLYITSLAKIGKTDPPRETEPADSMRTQNSAYRFLNDDGTIKGADDYIFEDIDAEDLADIIPLKK